MTTSVFIAKILGPCCLIIGVGMLLNREYYEKMMEDFCKNTSMIFLGGMAALLIGLVIVLKHNIWVAGWPVIITIYGWGGIIKGIWLTVFPSSVAGYMNIYQKYKSLIVIHSAFVIGLGIVLSVLGYCAR